MIDETVIDMTTDDALLESLSEHKIEDLKLQPFSLVRQAVATSLCDLGSSTLFNAIMTVWVCTLSPEEALEAHSELTRAKIRAFEWAESRGYSLWNWKPLIDMYNRLNRESAAASKARIQQDQLNGQDEIPNAGGQPI
jgi:hypothetical protein